MTFWSMPKELVADIPSAERRQDEGSFAATAALLAAAGASEHPNAPRYLVTLFQTDRAGVLKCMLEALADPKAKEWQRWGITAFSVEASVTASLAEVAVVAIVVRPVFHSDADGREFQYLSTAQIEALAASLVDELFDRLLDHYVDNPGDGEPSRPTARLLRIADEAGLYAGRHFREVRFGLPRHSATAAARCGELIRRFSQVLKSQSSPIAYVHYPHRWNAYDDERWDWLRIAFAVSPGVGRDAAIEIAAWELATQYGLPVSTYDPRLPGRFMSDRFSHLATSSDRDLPSDLSAGPGERVGMCLEGEARVGLIADVLDDDFLLDLYGCTIAVLHGHTVANLVLSPEAARVLQRRIELLQAKIGGYMDIQRFPVETNVEVVARPSSAKTTFWVAWLTHERAGLINSVLDTIYDRFRAVNARIPNIMYESSRVLSHGYSCAGKLKFSCSSSDAQRVGLLDGDAGTDTSSISTSSAADEIRSELRQTLLHSANSGDADWRPPNPGWSRVPIQVSGSEPREEPWGTLGLPDAPLEVGQR